MTPALEYPVATARISSAAAASLPFERRIGRFVGRASSRDVFDRFGRVLAGFAREGLSTPFQFLTLPQLKTLIASRFDGLPDASRDLIEGYVFELLSLGQLGRLQTLSRNMNPYQVVFWHTDWHRVRAAKHALLDELSAKQHMTVRVAKLFPEGHPAASEKHLAILFGHLMYLGLVSTDIELYPPLTHVRLPYASSLL